MERRRLLAALGSAALLTALAGCSGPGDPSTEDPSLILGRAWFERKPADARDRVHQLVLVRRPQRGAFVEASGYKLSLEVFEYDRDGGRVRVTFPQDGRTATFDFKITACHDGDFDLCLELSANPWSGPKKYYSVREQEGGALEDGEVAERARRVVAVIGGG